MRARFRKDSSMIGKLSNHHLSLSSSLHQAENQSHPSAILPCIQSKECLSKNQDSRKFMKMQRKASIINNFEEDSDKPLPQIRVSFSKIYQLRKVCSKNPEDVASFYENNSKISQMDLKPAELIGHIYSPRSRSVVDPDYPKHRESISTRAYHTKHLSQSKSKFRREQQPIALPQPFRQSKKVKVKIIDYNRRLNQSQDYPVSFKDQQTQSRLAPVETVEGLKQQSTQSRVIPIEPVAASSQFNQLKQSQQIKVESQQVKKQKRKMILKDNGEVGFIQGDQEQIGQEKDDLAFIWQQNYLQPKSNEPLMHAFFLEESHQNEEINKIRLDTPLSQLKIMLIQIGKTNKIAFDFPSILLNTITSDVTQAQVHLYAQTIFSFMLNQIKPQIISSKKYQNCLLVTTKVASNNQYRTPNKLALLWYYSGRVYVGGWSDASSKDGSLGFKQGLGLQYYPANFIYFGSFNRNARDGYGIMKKYSKQIYVGEWQENKRSGWGKVYNYEGNLVFDGDFEAGRFKQQRISVK